MNRIEKLDSIRTTAGIHADRIKIAFKHLHSLLPFTADNIQTITEEDLGFLELLTSRFAKLQDLIGSKIFPLLLDLAQENIQELSTLDRLNKLEKLGLLPSAKEWIDMRTIRNLVTHEYPDQPQVMAEQLDKIINEAQRLLSYWEYLNAEIDKIKASFIQQTNQTN
jgi:hypothetical protein